MKIVRFLFPHFFYEPAQDVPDGGPTEEGESLDKQMVERDKVGMPEKKPT